MSKEKLEPFVLSFDGYDDVDDIGSKFEPYLKWKWKKVAYTSSNFRGYWGLFYTGKMPSVSTVTKLLIDKGYDPDLEGSEILIEDEQSHPYKAKA